MDSESMQAYREECEPECSESIGFPRTNALVMCWTPCVNWEDLPVGSWLVKISKDRKPYHVATVTLNNQNSKNIIVGGHFSCDMGEIIAYTPFEEYESE